MTGIEDDFERASKKPKGELPFLKRNAKLVPYIRKWIRARESDPDGTANPSEFYDNFLRPHGITVSRSRFYAILKDGIFEEAE